MKGATTNKFWRGQIQMGGSSIGVLTVKGGKTIKSYSNHRVKARRIMKPVKTNCVSLILKHFWGKSYIRKVG